MYTGLSTTTMLHRVNDYEGEDLIGLVGHHSIACRHSYVRDHYRITQLGNVNGRRSFQSPDVCVLSNTLDLRLYEYQYNMIVSVARRRMKLI